MKCIRCDIEQPEENFSWRYKDKGVRRKDCKACVRLNDKKRYENPLRKAEIRLNAARRRQELMDKVWEYKNNNNCVDCDESDPIVLEFDHLPQFDKTENISVMIRNGVSWENIQKEIAKCELVCANCHRRRTHTRGGWVRNITICV